jgi:hypothetical protein
MIKTIKIGNDTVIQDTIIDGNLSIFVNEDARLSVKDCNIHKMLHIYCYRSSDEKFIKDNNMQTMVEGCIIDERLIRDDNSCINPIHLILADIIKKNNIDVNSYLFKYFNKNPNFIWLIKKLFND